MNKEYYFPDGVPSKWKKMESLESEGNNLYLWRTSGVQETEATPIRSLGQEDSLEEKMAIHSSILALRVTWTEEPGGLQW